MEFLQFQSVSRWSGGWRRYQQQLRGRVLRSRVELPKPRASELPVV